MNGCFGTFRLLASLSLERSIVEKGRLERNCEAMRLREAPRVWKRLKGVRARGRRPTTTLVLCRPSLQNTTNMHPVSCYGWNRSLLFGVSITRRFSYIFSQAKFSLTFEEFQNQSTFRQNSTGKSQHFKIRQKSPADNKQMKLPPLIKQSFPYLMQEPYVSTRLQFGEKLFQN